MTLAGRLTLVLRFIRRELVSGELTILALALVVAVMAMSSVAFFSDRVERALTTQATQLLAADLVLNGNQPAPDPIRREAEKRGLRLADNISFPSMVFSGGQAALATYKSVSDNYPLRGEVSVRLADGRVETGSLRPAAGTAWADARLMRRLKLKLGDTLGVGGAQLRLAGEIVREPDGAMDLYNFVPRLMFNRADLAATGLIQEGSRARWRLMFAGDDRGIADFRQWLDKAKPKDARLENVEEARPEVRTALERARRFLGLTAMLTVALAASAVALVVRRYLARHWQQVAVLRCLGLTAGEVWGLFVSLFLLLGLLAGALGTAGGFGVQLALMRLASGYVGEILPDPGWLTWLVGPLASLVLLAGLALPPLMGIRDVPPAAVLRDELTPTRQGVLAPLLALVALLGLAAWQVGDLAVAGWLLAGMLGFFAAVGALALGVVYLMRRLPRGRRVGWRFGIANIARRHWLAVIQIVSLSVGLMALLTLTIVRDDLIGAWQRSVPADAPNKFVINIQRHQLDGVRNAFAVEGRAAPELAPMVRARLIAINEHPVRPSAYEDERARRLAEREFNLSWRDELPPGNKLTAGQWWQPQKRIPPQFSVERELAATLGIKLGDTLVFDLAGTAYRAKVSSLREVPWDSFRVNFFVIGTPGQFSQQPASWITSFRLEAADEDFVNRLVGEFPNLTVIDVGAILSEVRAMMDKLSRGIEAMFGLALAAGVLVLWASLAATRDERLFDVGLMRALGASRRQVRSVVLAELAWLGAFSGLLAALGAMGIGALASVKLFNLPLVFNPWLLPAGVASGALVVVVAGWPLVGRVTRTSPMAVLRAI
ncbi:MULTISPECIES: ABC transporter permease [unclassified Chromobacterium]|uniref:ABC transporter permease n=1 Tax=unclassified Chromobacterium TaxID=2641838 RepID=UPI000D31A406|nr:MULTISPECIES: FtsX-like permease family protein [unclassified Chromobacterium]PTU63848.1 oxidoreductase [Chromobacterium sp. Panama]UJB32107.1 FtsX-like permease family protein [Chromobacterium sp. Beijing]